MKKFFNITESYQFDLNDLRAVSLILNVALIVIFGLVASWYGLTIAIIELVHDIFTPNRRINIFLLHGATAILNIYFLNLLLTS